MIAWAFQNIRNIATFKIVMEDMDFAKVAMEYANDIENGLCKHWLVCSDSFMCFYE